MFFKGETTIREGIKRYFAERLCDKMKKPTGRSAPSELIRRAQAIYQRILQKNDAAVYGDSSDFSDEDGSDRPESPLGSSDIAETAPYVMTGTGVSIPPRLLQLGIWWYLQLLWQVFL